MEAMKKNELTKLPLGYSDFVRLREEDCIYADKTALIYQLCAEGSKIFISRPRRFGKSLLTSTFESLFKYGLRDFQGLAIEKLWKDKTYDVVHLDFSEIREFSDKDDFELQFDHLLLSNFGAVGFIYDEKKGYPLVQISAWLATLPVSSLVILIDEYDAPLTNCLGNSALFNDVRRIMSSFFLKLKARDRCLRFSFMTGITKYRQTSIFSELNNFDDISLNPEYGTLIGLTESEIRENFEAFIRKAGTALKMSEAEVMDGLRENYDGFCFDEEASRHVFCPWSVLNFFKYPERGFRNYWYESGGQPTVLMKYLANHALEEPMSFAEARQIRVSELGAARKYDDIGLEALLAQAGYLTIRSVRSNGYAVLGYPNKEVSVSMAELYANELLRGRPLEGIDEPLIEEVLSAGSTEEVVRRFNEALNAIDYMRFPIRDEAACRAYLQVLLIGAAMLPTVETHTALGRSDLEVESGSRHWVFEIKFSQTGEDAQALLSEALEQMRSRRYGETAHGKTLIRAALVFSGKDRRFVRWEEA